MKPEEIIECIKKNNISKIKEYFDIHPENINLSLGNTAPPLYTATMLERTEIVEYLVNKNAKLDIMVNYTEKNIEEFKYFSLQASPIYKAIEIGNEKLLEIFANKLGKRIFFIECIFRVSKSYTLIQGYGPIECAFFHKNMDLLFLLYEYSKLSGDKDSEIEIKSKIVLLNNILILDYVKDITNITHKTCKHKGSSRNIFNVKDKSESLWIDNFVFEKIIYFLKPKQLKDSWAYTVIKERVYQNKQDVRSLIKNIIKNKGDNIFNIFFEFIKYNTINNSTTSERKFLDKIYRNHILLEKEGNDNRGI